MLSCFTNISAKIVLHILCYGSCTEKHILVKCSCHKKHQKLLAQRLFCLGTKKLVKSTHSLVLKIKNKKTTVEVKLKY